MPLVQVGVDHTTCPVSVRESMVLSPEHELSLLGHLISSSVIDEVLVLSTCARTEVYVTTEHPDDAKSVVRDSLESLNPEARAAISFRTEAEVVKHLFRVAAGLESQIVGEYEIAGQVRAAAQAARAAETMGPELDGLLRAAVHCSRRLRSETDLGRLDLSVAGAAVSLLRESRDIADSAVLIIGAGKIARLLAQEFHPAGRLTISNRNAQAAQALASRFQADALPFDEAVNRLDEFDVVCCATRSREPILTSEQIRRATPIVIFDLSLPRNVEVSAGLLPGVELHDVDAVSPGLTIGSESAELVESVVDSEVRDYMGRRTIRLVAPIIASLRAHVDHVRAVETARIGPKLQHMDARERAAVEELTGRLIDRMFHHLVVRLKLAALTDADLIKAAEFFFAHGESTVFPAAPDELEEEAAEPASTGSVLR